MTIRVTLCMLAAGLWLMPPLAAHHPFSAEFDASRPGHLDGRVTQVNWINPHVYLFLEVPDPSDKTRVSSWKVQLGSPELLQQSGWATSSVRVGMEIGIDGFRAKDSSPLFGGTTVTIKTTGQRFSTPMTGMPVVTP